MLKDYLSVAVICYDPYLDAIKLNPYFINKFWSDCSINLFYVTSNVDVGYGWQTHKTNGDLSYYGRLDVALKNVRTKYVMLLLDDYFIDKRVDEKNLLSIVNFMEKNNVDYCELFTMFSIPKGKTICDNGYKYVEISKNRKYRITLQPSIFSIKLLNELIEKRPCGAWDAELAFMEKEFKKYDAFFALSSSFSITNYIDKGEVTRKALKLLKKEKKWNKQRNVMSLKKTIKKWCVAKLYNYVPQKLKDKVKGNNVIYKG